MNFWITKKICSLLFLFARGGICDFCATTSGYVHYFVSRQEFIFFRNGCWAFW